MADKTPTDDFKDYLRGIARYQRTEALQRLQLITNWAALAKQEVEQRATQFIHTLDPVTLQALADGRIDAPQAIEHVLGERR